MGAGAGLLEFLYPLRSGVAAMTKGDTMAGPTWREKARAIHEVLIKGRPPYGPEDRRFLALALAGEVGELANVIKKEWRGDFDHPAGNLRALVAGEIADIRIYLELLAACFAVDVDEACEVKTVELLERWPHTKSAVAALDGYPR